MSHQFEFTFDPDFIRAALRRDVLWRGYVLAGLLLILALVARFLLGIWNLTLTTSFVLASVFIIWLFHRLLRGIATRVCNMWTTQAPDGVIRYELDDDGFNVVTTNSRARFEWQYLRRLWCYEDVWLLEIVKMQSVFFPPDQAPAAAMDFIVERCRAADVRI